MMKAIISIVFLLFIAVSAHAEPGHEQHGATSKKHLTDSTMVMTEQGLFSVEMSIPKNRFLVGVNNVDIIIHDNQGRDVTGADVTFIPWMPEMGHGAFEAPVVIEKGKGLYRVENIILVMGGHWEMRIDIKKGDVQDKTMFNYPVVRTTDKYDYIRVDTPAGSNAVIGMKNPLEELVPEIVTENGTTIKVFNLTVKDLGFEIFPEKPMMGWGFNGTIPGPTIRVTEGDRIRVIVKNETADGEHTLHVHGQSKPVIMDGVPFLGQMPIKKGESYTYEFTVNNIGTSWYHCHVDSAHHVDMGMYGAFVVEPKKEKLKYDREYVYILDEFPTSHVHVHEDAAETDEEEHGIVTEHEGSPPVHEHEGKKPPKRDWYPKTYNPRQEVYDGFTINGRSFPLTEPMLVKEGERVRIRFINTGYQQHFMHVHSHKFIVVARDGSYVNEPQKIDTVGIGPGQRVDIILFADNPGIWPFHCHRLNHISNENIYPGGMLMFMRYEE